MFLCNVCNLLIQCPTTIVPFFGDQFFWGDRIHQKGLGPAPIPIEQLSVEGLSDAITFMLQPDVSVYASPYPMACSNMPICYCRTVGVLEMLIKDFAC